MPNNDSFQPVLQWRKLDGDSTAKKDAPWRSSGNREMKHSPETETKKVSRQDSINAVAVCRRRQLEDAAKTNKKSSEHDRRTHIVESRKTQYSHCNFGAKEEKSPLVYNHDNSTKHETKKKAAPLHLQLQPLSMDQDVSKSSRRTNESAKDEDENQIARKNESYPPAVCDMQ